MRATTILLLATIVGACATANTPDDRATGDRTASVTVAGYGWGLLADGRTGSEDLAPAPTPHPVELAATGTPLHVAAGESHSCAATRGSIHCWGRGSEGQLGVDIDSDYTSVPVTVPRVTGDITALAAAKRHTCAIADEQVWCWGYNYYGQLGDGTTTNRHQPVRTPVPLLQDEQIVSIRTTATTTCVRTSGDPGRILCTGDLGAGPATRMQETAAAHDTDGTPTLIACSSTTSCVNAPPAATPGLWVRNSTLDGGCDTREGATRCTGVAGAADTDGVTHVTNGMRHICVIADQQLTCWGDNTEGQLGTPGSGTVAAQPLGGRTTTAAAAGYLHTCAIADGQVWCWGYGATWQLGRGGPTTTPDPHPNLLGGRTSGPTIIDGGEFQSCTLIGRDVRCVGRGLEGYMGSPIDIGSITPVPIGTGQEWDGKVDHLDMGWRHACILTDQTVWCWGYNVNGQVGRDDVYPDATVPVAVQPGPMEGLPVTDVSAGDEHTCAIAGGRVFCWGLADEGRFGDGRTGIHPVTLIDSLPKRPGWDRISVGHTHTCAITGGELWCWGGNSNGQVGDGTRGGIVPPTRIHPDGARHVTDVVAGTQRTCAIADRQLLCWGEGGSGQTGDPQSAPRLTPTPALPEADADVTAIALGYSTTCAIVGDDIVCLGTIPGTTPDRSSGRTLPRPAGAVRPVAIGAGAFHHTALWEMQAPGP